MKTIALRRLAELNPPTPQFDALPPDRDVLFLPLEAVWADERADQTRRAAKSAVANGYTRFHAGDIVSPKVTPTFQAGRTMIARAVGAGTTELHVLRARAGVDPRWVAYALRSNHYLGEGVTAFQGVAGLQRVPENFIAEFRIADVDREEQRRIADFLDDRVARIDQIIASRQAQLALLSQVLASQIDALVASSGRGGRTRLGRLARIQTGLTVDSARAWSTGTQAYPYLRVANVQPGWLDLHEVKQISVDEATARGARLRVGDVLMTEGGDVDKLGRGTVWNGEVEGCLHQNHVFAVRCNTSQLMPEFLSLYTRCSDARAYFESTGSRSTNLASTSSSKVAAMPLPVRTLDEQGVIVDRYRECARSAEQGEQALGTSIACLQEYKQSLITAAVTGEFDVTTASTRIPG